MALTLLGSGKSAFSFIFPYYFTLYACLIALLLLYYLLCSSRIRAILVVKISLLINKLFSLYQFSENSELSIGGIGFAFLSGQIYLNHIHFVNSDFRLDCLQCTIRFNWWYRQVRQSIMEQENIHQNESILHATLKNQSAKKTKKSTQVKPCRLSIECVGLEIIIHGNEKLYDKLASIILGEKFQIFDNLNGNNPNIIKKTRKFYSIISHSKIFDELSPNTQPLPEFNSVDETKLMEDKIADILSPNFINGFQLQNCHLKISV